MSNRLLREGLSRKPSQVSSLCLLPFSVSINVDDDDFVLYSFLPLILIMTMFYSRMLFSMTIKNQCFYSCLDICGLSNLLRVMLV